MRSARSQSIPPAPQRRAQPETHPMIRSLTFAGLMLALAACDQGPSEQSLLASARGYVDKQDHAAAVIELKNLLSRNPGSAEGRLLMGRMLLSGGDAKAAAIELAKALELGAPEDEVVPALARALLGAGESTQLLGQFGRLTLPSAGAMADLQATLAAAHAAQGNADSARQAAEKAMAAQPGHAPATIMLARLDLMAGDRAAALRRLEALLVARPGHEDAGLLRGELLMATRVEVPAAIEQFRQVRDANPKSVAGHAALVNALVQIDRLDEARQAFEPLKPLAPRHPETLFLQAQFAYADNKLKEAAETLDAILARAPNNLRTLTLAGATQFRLQQYPLAEGLLGRALKIAPDLRLARHLLAQTQLRSAQPARALDVLQPLLAAPQPDKDTLALAGEAYLQAGDPTRSEAAFRQALKAAPVDTALQTKVATAQLARGDNAAALAQLESITRSDPGIQADQALVNERIRLNDVAGALKALDNLARKIPDHPYPLGLRGRVLARSGDTVRATASLEQALAKDPKYLPAAVSLAEIDLVAGRADQARQRIERVVQADPRNVHPRLALVELHMRQGANETTLVSLLREAVKADPSQAAGHLALVNRLIIAGNGPAALAAAQEAEGALPSDAAVIDALGRAQITAGDSRSAAATFKRLATLQPTNAEPLARMAEAQQAGGDAEGATATLRQALRLQPGHPLALRNLAMLQVQGQRVQEAVALAREVQLKQAKDSLGFVLEGEVQGAAGNWAAASAAYREALRREASNSHLAARLHGSLLAAGKGPEAARMADDWLRAHPKDTDFRYHLGDQAVAAKDWPAAESNFRAVLAAQPRHAAAMNNLAWVMATQRKPGATALAEQAVALLPDRAPLLDTLAYALEADNQLDLALATQRRAVDLDPKAPELRLRLAQLLVRQGNKGEARKELAPLAQLGPRFSGQAEVEALLKTLQ
jgi:putative PEP-CTERM system TPR-repeat lipoprotein